MAQELLCPMGVAIKREGGGGRGERGKRRGDSLLENTGNASRMDGGSRKESGFAKAQKRRAVA